MHIGFYKKSCKSFFKKYGKQKDIIVRLVEVTIDREVVSGMTKAKLATRKRINDKNTYEFQLNVDTIGSIRTVSPVFDRRTIVCSISRNLQRSAFNKDFDKIIAKL